MAGRGQMGQSALEECASDYVRPLCSCLPPSARETSPEQGLCLIHPFISRTCFGPGNGQGSVMQCGRKNGKMEGQKAEREGKEEGGSQRERRRGRQAVAIPFCRQLIWVALSRLGSGPTSSSGTVSLTCSARNAKEERLESPPHPGRR